MTNFALKSKIELIKFRMKNFNFELRWPISGEKWLISSQKWSFSSQKWSFLVSKLPISNKNGRFRAKMHDFDSIMVLVESKIVNFVSKMLIFGFKFADFEWKWLILNKRSTSTYVYQNAATLLLKKIESRTWNLNSSQSGEGGRTVEGLTSKWYHRA